MGVAALTEAFGDALISRYAHYFADKLDRFFCQATP